MFVHIWRMRARKKRAEEYEKFGRQVTLPSLRKIEGCLGAHFIKVFESRKPEYLWLVFWKDHRALEQARTNPLWREQIKRFEAGNFYKTIPLQLVCEELGSFTVPAASAKSKTAAKPPVRKKAAPPDKAEPVEGQEEGESQSSPEPTAAAPANGE